MIYSFPSRGAGGARNEGLLIAKGTWVLFLDADDFFVKNAFSCLEQVINYSEDIVYFKMSSCYSDTLEKADRGVFYCNLVCSFFKKEQNAELKLRHCHSSPCAKLIKLNLIRKNNILFDEVIASNDVMFSLKVGHYAKSITCLDNFVYCATISEGTLTKTISK